MVVVIDSRKTFFDLANGVFPSSKEESQVPNVTAMASKSLFYKEISVAPRDPVHITINIVFGKIAHSDCSNSSLNVLSINTSTFEIQHEVVKFIFATNRNCRRNNKSNFNETTRRNFKTGA